MHWVDRGPEPAGLGEIHSNYTPRWVQYYTAHIGSKPTDDHWRGFHDDLESVFRGLCAYCEEFAGGEVEHFQPKSKFPDLVYSWTNWLFVCHECNHSKLDKWPAGGYVDPCAISDSERPEHYFSFNTQSGYITPKRNLPLKSFLKAQETIKDLGLNDMHHLGIRGVFLDFLSARFPINPGGLTSNFIQDVFRIASRSKPLSSLIRAWLLEHGYPVEDTESG